jgi:hypothetical protein
VGPEREQWTIHWLDSRRPGRLGPPVRGGFTRGRTDPSACSTATTRSTAARSACASSGRASRRCGARWEQAFSRDEGNSWETNWYMDFTRL